MKRIVKVSIICSVIATLGFMSCDKKMEVDYGYTPNPNPSGSIVGSWKLVEVLADPGNGSGTFQPVTSEKVIQIFGDSTFTANGQMCTMNSDTIGSETGILMDSINITLTLSPCWGVFPFTYQHTGNELIISYPCIEACRQKYIRI